ncbi:MAG: hypothetical protein P8X57_13100, partial [Cyclobacteriaceae bacterium]
LAFQIIAQDRIFTKKGETIDARVQEIGLDEVKYYEWQQDGPLLSIAVDFLLKIELMNGRVIEFKDPLTDPESYADQKKSALKLNFLSPLFENLAFSYEHSIRPGRSFETELGLIGLGFNTNSDERSSGIHLAAGYKFIRTPDFYSRRMKYAHILKGGYVKPQILLSIYKNKYLDYGTPIEQERNVVSGAFVINLGKQIIYDDSFVFDYSAGVGYGFESHNDPYGEGYYERPNQYGFLLANDLPLVFTFNLKIGFLL